MRVDRVADESFAVALLRRRNDLGAKRQRRRNRIVHAQGLAQFSGLLFGIDLGVSVGIGSKIALAKTHFSSWTLHLNRNAAKLAVPILVFRIVTQRVVGRTVAESLADGFFEIIGAQKRPAACFFRHGRHGCMSGQLIVRTLAEFRSPSGTITTGARWSPTSSGAGVVRS